MAVKLNYKGNCLYSCKGIQLTPGLNTLEEASVEALLLHPLFKARVDSGEIEIEKEQIILVTPEPFKAISAELVAYNDQKIAQAIAEDQFKKRKKKK